VSVRRRPTAGRDGERRRLPADVAPAPRRLHTCVACGWTVTVDRRSAVLIIRVWVEDGMESFRARLTSADPDRDDGDRHMRVVASPDAVLDAAGEWLGSFEQRVAERSATNESDSGR
jgi:hypothetical protein